MVRSHGPRRGDLGGCSATCEALEEPYGGVGPWAELALGLFYSGRGFGRPSEDDGTASGEDSARMLDCVLRVFGAF